MGDSMQVSVIAFLLLFVGLLNAIIGNPALLPLRPTPFIRSGRSRQRSGHTLQTPSYSRWRTPITLLYVHL